jgi:hypothetical protein
MKKIIFLLIAGFFNLSQIFSQVFSTVTTTGYNLDAVAETTTAASTTGMAIDGSNYVLYSASYAAFYSGATGIPNSGLIASGTRTYQLQPYTQNNMLYLTQGITDSLIFSSPASYGALSLLAFATEGTGSMNITVRFTDNTTQVFNGISLPDWFAASTAIISGFDRCSRVSGTPNYQTSQPKMFAVDLTISCSNRTKLISNIKIQNSGTNARICVMAVSGSTVPFYNLTTTPVNCSGGNNGSATITPSGGLGPYSYTVNSSPIQTTPTPANLPTGVYSYTAQDNAACPLTGTFAITQSLVPQPSLSVTATTNTICAGSTLTINVSGASTYTWNNSLNVSTFSVTPAGTVTYTVSGLTSANCLRTGSITIIVNPLPVLSISGLPPSLCVNSSAAGLTVSPSGGLLSGQGVVSGSFDPSILLPGNYTVTYSYTDINNCSSVTTATTIVNALPIISFTVSPLNHCLNSQTVSLNALPSGGIYSGAGINGTIFSPTLAGVGTKTITYTYTDANNCTNSSASTVIVNPLPAITFTISKKQFCRTGTSVPLNSTPSTGNYAGPGVTGNFFNPALAGSGSHTITYTYTDINGCTSQAAVTLTVTDCTDLAENSLFDIKVFPNPSDGIFTIKANEKTLVTISNQLGQVVRTINLDDQNAYRISINDLSPGTYFLFIKGDFHSVTKKLIVSTSE